MWEEGGHGGGSGGGGARALGRTAGGSEARQRGGGRAGEGAHSAAGRRGRRALTATTLPGLHPVSAAPLALSRARWTCAAAGVGCGRGRTARSLPARARAAHTSTHTARAPPAPGSSPGRCCRCPKARPQALPNSSPLPCPSPGAPLTCPMLPLARGASSRTSNSSPDGSPNARATAASVWRKACAGADAWSTSSAAVMSGGKRSWRVADHWPHLTHAGCCGARAGEGKGEWRSE